MTDQERITQLEMRIAQLEARIAALESKSNANDSAATENARVIIGNRGLPPHYTILGVEYQPTDADSINRFKPNKV